MWKVKKKRKHIAMRIWEEQNSGGKLQVKNRKCNMDQQSKKDGRTCLDR